MCSSDLFAFVPIVFKLQMPEVRDYVMDSWAFLQDMSNCQESTFQQVIFCTGF